MAENCKNENSSGLASWIVTIVFLVTPLWPIGLFLLFRKLSGTSKGTRSAGHPYEKKQRMQTPGTQGMGAKTQTTGGSTQSQQVGAERKTPRHPAGQSGGLNSTPVNLKAGKGLTIGGAVLSIVFGITLVSTLPIALLSEGLLTTLAIMSPVLGFFCGGLAMLWGGTQRTKQARRFRKYLALVGKRDSISIATLAQAMPTSIRRACDDLQEMLARGMFATGYLDMSNGRLILSDEGLSETQVDPSEHKEEPTLDLADDTGVLAEIRAVNAAIADPAMSQKIDRIEEITSKIFVYQKQSPGREGQLRSFLSYYLPTTLKILRAYGQMEAQGIDGENIRAAKTRIENMMDKVVDGFEKQLDRLFQDSAMDITTDVEVLERMLSKDGLAGGQGLTLGG